MKRRIIGMLIVLPLLTYGCSAPVDEHQDVNRLIQKLEDLDRDIRQAAADSLLEMGTPALEPLIAALKDPDRPMRVRWLAAEALGRAQNARAIDTLIAVMKNPDEIVDLREQTVRALGKSGDPRALKPLIATLEDKHGSVRLAAAEALGRDVRAVEPLVESLRADPYTRSGAADALAEIGASALDSLIALLKSANPDIRAHAARALGKMGNKQAVEPLIAALKDQHERTRAAAAAALSKLGDARAVRPLIAALKDEAKTVRVQAAQALGEAGDRQAIDSLMAVLKDPDWNVRESAADALRSIERGARPLF